MQDNLFKKGRANFSKGNYRAAGKDFKEITKRNPYFINGWINLGNVYIKLKKYHKAIRVLKEGLKLEPKEVLVWKSLGVAYFGAKNYQEVINWYGKCIEKEKNNEKYWNNLGAANSMLNNHKEAIKAYKHALDLAPEYLSSWRNLCILYSKLGIDFDYNRYKSNSDVAWYFLSKALLKERVFKDALETCNRTLRLNPRFKAAYILRNEIKYEIRLTEKLKIPKYEPSLRTAIPIQKVENLDVRFKQTQERIKSRRLNLVNKSSLTMDERFKIQQEKFKQLKNNLESPEIEIDAEKSDIETSIEESNDYIKAPIKTSSEVSEDKKNIFKSSLPISSQPTSTLPDVPSSKSSSRRLTATKSKIVLIDDKYCKTDDLLFVIDGANVALSKKNSNKKGLLKSLQILEKKLKSYGITRYKILCDRSLRHRIDEQSSYLRLIDMEKIIETPAGTQADNFILNYAKENDAFVISNDRFKDFYDIFGKEWIKKKRITFTFIDHSIFFDRIYNLS